MKILLHAFKENGVKIQLDNLIAKELPEVKTVVTDSRQLLSETLCRPLHNFTVLIAFVENSDNIMALLSLKPLFENIKLILVSGSNEFVSAKDSILLLEPVYTKSSDNNFMDVISVLKRIEKHQGRSVNRLEISEEFVL